MVSGPDLGQRSKAETSRWQVGIGVSLAVAGTTCPPLGREGPLHLPCMLDVQMASSGGVRKPLSGVLSVVALLSTVSWL